MSEKEQTTLDKINIVRGLLDKLADAQGRAKCGYIYIIDEFMDKIQNDVLIIEEKLNDIVNKDRQE